MSDYTRKRWMQIRSLRVVPRMFHQSCVAMMVPNPLNKLLPDVPYCTSNRWRRSHGVPIMDKTGHLLPHGITYRRTP